MTRGTTKTPQQLRDWLRRNVQACLANHNQAAAGTTRPARHYVCQRTLFWSGVGLMLQCSFSMLTRGAGNPLSLIVGALILGAGSWLRWRGRYALPTSAGMLMTRLAGEYLASATIVILLCTANTYPAPGITRAVVVGLFLSVHLMGIAIQTARSRWLLLIGVGPRLASWCLVAELYREDLANYPITFCLTTLFATCWLLVCLGGFALVLGSWPIRLSSQLAAQEVAALPAEER